MTTISACIHEANPRRGGVAIYNGLHWEATELPALTGSPKQIAWAETIRANGIHWAGQIMQRWAERRLGATPLQGVPHGTAASFDALNAEIADAAAKIAAGVDAKTEARWWIDNCEALDDGRSAHKLIAA